MASLIFALPINDVVANFNSTFNVWYLEDGNLGGELDMVLGDLSTIEGAFWRIGLHLKSNQYEVAVLENPSPKVYRDILTRVLGIIPKIRETSAYNLTLLGSPMGTDVLNPAIADYSNKV